MAGKRGTPKSSVSAPRPARIEREGGGGRGRATRPFGRFDPVGSVLQTLVPAPSPAPAASTEDTQTAETITLRRRIRVWPLDAIALIVLYLLLSLAIGDVLLAAGVLVVLGLLIRRPKVVLRPTGITMRGREVPWKRIGAIDDVIGLRSRYVRIHVAGDEKEKWFRVPALRTSRILGDPRYPATVEQLRRFANEYNPRLRVEAVRKGPAWVYPAILAVLLLIPLYNQNPWRYWLPQNNATAVPTSCGAVDADTAEHLGLPGSPQPARHPIRSGGDACIWQGAGHVLVVEVMSFSRTLLLNGAGAAHRVYQRESYVMHPDDPSGVPYARLGPVPADEAQAPAFAFDRESGGVVLFIARKANVLVFMEYSSQGAGVPDLENMRRTDDVFPADLDTVQNVGTKILNAIKVG